MDQIVTTQNNQIIPTQPGSLDQNPAAVYLSSLTKASGRRSQQQALNAITDILFPGTYTAPVRPEKPKTRNAQELAKWHDAREQYKLDRQVYDQRCFSVPWGDLRFQHTNAIRSRLVELHSHGTATRMLCALRGTLKSAWRLDQMTSDEYAHARDLETIHGDSLLKGRGLTSGEIHALMMDCCNDNTRDGKRTPAGVRDAAIISLLYSCGMRREEFIALEFKNYDPDTGRLEILGGKRGKDRINFVLNGARDALNEWVSIRGNWDGALFCPINKSGVISHKPMTTQALYNMLVRRATHAGVKRFSPHDLRRACISDLLYSGADVLIVSKLVGHDDPKTTLKYDRRPQEAMSQAVSKLHVPFVSMTK